MPRVQPGVHQAHDGVDVKDAATLLDNAGITQYLAVGSPAAAEELSVMCGEMTVLSRNTLDNAGSSGQMFKPLGSTNTGTSVSVSKVRRRLLTPDAAAAMPANQMVLKVSAERPLLCRKPRYFELPEFTQGAGGKPIFDKWGVVAEPEVAKKPMAAHEGL